MVSVIQASGHGLAGSLDSKSLTGYNQGVNQSPAGGGYPLSSLIGRIQLLGRTVLLRN